MPNAAPPTGLRFEHHPQPVLGIGHRLPRLSWYLPAADAGFRQDAYEVELTPADGATRRFRVASAEQVLVPWPGAPLAARERMRVRVRVSCGGQRTEWSEPATVEAGLFEP